MPVFTTTLRGLQQHWDLWKMPGLKQRFAFSRLLVRRPEGGDIHFLNAGQKPSKQRSTMSFGYALGSQDAP